MMVGQTVWYRISDEDVEQIGRRRMDAINSHFLVDQTGAGSGAVMHFGDKVERGELLPAEVVRIYSHADLGTQDEIFPELAATTFGGKADIRVKLPGSDILYVPKASMGTDRGQTVKYGLGKTHLPPLGTFTVVAPAELATF
jgi:hypothetical protein